jgi:pimeloyl-ACP methyl ester carboxylesterase
VAACARSLRNERGAPGFTVRIAAALLCLRIGATAVATPLQTHPCRLEGVLRPARCGVLRVPENPDRPEDRQLDIHFAVVAALAKPLPDPIVVLMGGPGEDAIGSAKINVERLGSILAERDLLLVDQRGTGESGALRCQLYSPATAADNIRDSFPPAAVERCERQLASSADLTRYTYPYFAHDLEEVRRALGYGPLNLFAGSYGTRAAQAFLRQYPHRVRSVYLGSVVPIDAGGPLYFAKTEQLALEKTFENCAADSACHTAFPALRAELASLHARLDAAQITLRVPGDPNPVALSRGRFAEWLRSKLYRPHDASSVPWIIHQAAAGNWAPVLDDMLDNARDADQDFSWGLFFAITCSEDIPFVSESAVEAATQGTFLGDYRLRQQQAACKPWPRSSLPPGYRKAVRSSVPTLFVTGDLDGGTPVWFTQKVAARFSNHAVAVARGQGHTEWSPCIASLYQRFVRDASVRGLDPKSCPAIPIPPFKTR